jgi:hypothetical protein
LGKVREVTGERLTVSLFSDEGEIIGEFSKGQFPLVKLSPGQVFRYEAVVKSPGKTEVLISILPDRHLSKDEILDLWEEVKGQLPDGDEH